MSALVAHCPFGSIREWTSGLILAVGVVGSAALVRGDEVTRPADASSDLHRRYAEARLTLAKLDLERALDADRQAGARVASDTDLRRLRARIRVLESQVEANRSHPHGNGIHGQRARAVAAAEVADEELDAVRAVHDRNPKAATTLDVARYEARAEIAHLRVALWEDPTNVPSLIDEMQLQIDQLTDHVLDLLDQIENQRTIIPPR